MENTGNNVVVCSGSIDGSLRWHYADGTLTISGSGELPCYHAHFVEDSNGRIVNMVSDAPWYDFAKQITTIVIENVEDFAVTSCFGAFTPCINLKYMSFNMDNWQTFTKYLMVEKLLHMIQKGYVFNDVVNIDRWLPCKIAQILKDFKRVKLATEPPDEVIDRMIFCFEEVAKYPNKYYSYSVPHEDAMEYSEKMKNEGMDLLKKHFFDLSW